MLTEEGFFFIIYVDFIDAAEELLNRALWAFPTLGKMDELYLMPPSGFSGSISSGTLKKITNRRTYLINREIRPI